MVSELYDFNHPIFKKHFIYRRLAKEHIELSKLKSHLLEVKPTARVGPLKIPVKYEIIYRVRSIVGIDAQKQPLFGERHVVEIALPKRFPLESPRIYCKTPVWHPNIKSGGKFVGRICGNTQNFGKGFELWQLVLRIGDILQYKNYHAENTPPYPEDSEVASWVLDFAEPNGILNHDKPIDSRPIVLEPGAAEPPQPRMRFKKRT